MMFFDCIQDKPPSHRLKIQACGMFCCPASYSYNYRKIPPAHFNPEVTHGPFKTRFL